MATGKRKAKTKAKAKPTKAKPTPAKAKRAAAAKPKASPKRPPHEQRKLIAPAPTLPTGGMDDASAQRLVAAWRARNREALPPKKLREGGFYVGATFGFSELLYDASHRVLVARRAPTGFAYPAPPSLRDRELMAARAEEKADQLRGTLAEIAELRSHRDQLFLVLRRDFTDPSISDAEFVAAVDELRDLMPIWRA